MTVASDEFVDQPCSRVLLGEDLRERTLAWAGEECVELDAVRFPLQHRRRDVVDVVGKVVNGPTTATLGDPGVHLGAWGSGGYEDLRLAWLLQRVGVGFRPVLERELKFVDNLVADPSKGR